MPQDQRDEDLDIGNSFETAPLLGEPQFGYQNIIGTPTDDLVDKDIYAIGRVPAGVTDTFYVGGLLSEMRIELIAQFDNGSQRILQRIDAGDAVGRAVEITYETLVDTELFVVITDVPSADSQFGGDQFQPESYVITHNSFLAFAQGALMVAQGEGFARDAESGEAGSFLLHILDAAGIADADVVDDDPITASTFGDDLILGNRDANTIDALEGDDEIRGLLGNDIIFGGRGADLIYGNQGVDTIYGGSQEDFIFGGQDADVIYGELGTDVIYGNRGLDILYGGERSDTIYGGQGGDLIYGGGGDDVLFGNRGSDGFFGGSGSDVFVIAGEEELSVVFDFNAGEGDLLAVAGGLKFANTPDGILVQQVGTGSQVILVGVFEFDERFVLDITI
ncbi:MAG: calcium-binding protein [Pseudomonadota bacterium]